MTVGLKRPANILSRRAAAVATLALLGSVVTLPLAAPASATAPECGLPVVVGTTATVTCNFTDAAQQWTVPPGVTSVTFDVYGAQGDGFPVEGFNGGRGGRSVATMTVTPGEVLAVLVGGSGGRELDTFGNDVPSGGFNGGGDPGSFCIFTSSGPFCGRSGFGGGGASDVRRAPYSLADRLIVAGGGGGNGSQSVPGAGGGSTGSSAVLSGETAGRTAGTGGNQDGSSGSGQLGEGSQASTVSDFVSGGYDGGGGGGGYYGGDGGLGASGGGGSGFTPDGTGMTTGVRDGTGLVIITYSVPTPKQDQAALTVTSVTGTFGTPLPLTTSGGSGIGAVSYAATGGTATGCAASGTTLTSTSAGTCIVTATKAGDAAYNAVSSAPTTVTFGKASQATLTITSTSGTFASPLTLTTTGGSGTGAVTYSAVDGTATGCSVAATTLTATSAGSCTVTASRAADANYTATSSAPTTVVLAKAPQAALTVTSTAGTTGTPLTLTTSGGSGTGAVTYSAVDATATGCLVAATTLTATTAGTCTVTATKATDANYLAVSSAPTTVTFGKAVQAALTLTSTSGTSGTPLTLTSSGGSGTGSVSYTAADGTATGCSAVGSTLTTTSAGTCTVTATKAGDTNFLPASSSPTTVTLDAAQVAQAPLIVTSTSGTFLTQLTLTTSGGSGSGAVTFSAVDGTATGCSVAGTALTSSSAGTCIVTATKAGNATYLPASSDPTTVTFGKAAQSALSVTSTSGTYGDPLTLTTSGGAGTGAVSYSATDGTASGCAVNGATLTTTSGGTCTITATKAGDTDYLPRSSAGTTVTFVAGTQATLSVTSTTVILGGALTTAGGSGTGAVTFTATDGTANGCAINGAALRATTIGTCVVTATKAGDGTFVPTSSAPRAVNVLYATTGFSTPKRTVTRSGSTITAKFALTDINGVSLSNAAGQALADSGAVQVRLNGPAADGPIVASDNCTWNRVKHWYECSLQTTKALTSGVNYYLIAYENPSTGFVTVPTIGSATNPLAIRFR